MSYLLDINALLALGFVKHSLHERVEVWMSSLSASEPPIFATCALTELGFVRILPQFTSFAIDVAAAKELLVKLKTDQRARFVFFADDHGADRLPPWVKSHQQTTDGHLAELAKAHGAELATLDEGIPNSLLIPR
jgi:predicted nucleic acid-binding protein